VGKFHVGDRWADQFGDEWFIYGTEPKAGAVMALCQATYMHKSFNSGGVQTVFGDKTWDNVPRLTRLISSERWIPFAEMMPEPPTKDDDRVMVIYRKAYATQMLEAYGQSWQDIGGRTLNTWFGTYKYTHWKYIQPPEAS
jgi:hypothetical protein